MDKKDLFKKFLDGKGIMLTQNRNTPPIILRLVNTPMSALEDMLPLDPIGYGKITQSIPDDTNESSLDQYVLSQYLLLLYINIFIFPQTSSVYKTVYDDTMAYVRSQKFAVKDSALKEFITNHIDTVCSWESLKQLEVAILRVKPELAYPNITNIIKIVTLMYGTSFGVNGVEAVVYRISLQKLDGYDKPTFVLSPLFQTVMSTIEIETVPSLFWKLLRSFNIEGRLTAPGELTQIVTLLGFLALPMDPTSLTIQMQKCMINGKKAGVPFINYLAMYLRERQLGLSYDLSPMADARRILMKRAHQFFGFGGTCIADYNYASGFLLNLSDVCDHNNVTVLSDKDRELIQCLSNGYPDSAIKFIKPISYDASTEAVNPVIPAPKTPKTPAASAPTDDAFSDDSDTLDTLNKNPQPIDENPDNNIDRTSDVGQDSAAANAKMFIPLALPTETIDDHLLRLMVLRYVDDMDKDPAPDITPENLETLKYWCDSWLFVASIDQTKKLLSQLKIAEKLKELV